MSFIEKPKEEKPSFEPANGDGDILGQIKDFIWETIKVVVFSLAIILPIRYFIIQPFMSRRLNGFNFLIMNI